MSSSASRSMSHTCSHGTAKKTTAVYVKSVSAEPLKQSRGEDDDDLVRISQELEGLTKDRQRLLAKQEKTFGITVDASEALKVEMGKTRAANNKLLQELEEGKRFFNKLLADFTNLQANFKSCKRQIRELQTQKQLWDETKQVLKVSEERCRKLTRVNKSMRHVLLKHNIDPNTDASTLVMHSPRDKAGVTSRYSKASLQKKRQINAVPLRKQLVSSKVMWR